MKPGSGWLMLVFAAAFFALGVFGLLAPRDTVVRASVWRTTGALDGLRVVWFRTGGVVICLMALVMAGMGVAEIATPDPSPPKAAAPFAPYAIQVGDGVERRDAPGNAMPVALYTNSFRPDGSHFDDVPGIPDSADIVVATIFHPTHMVVGESGDRVTVTVYVDCVAASAPPAGDETDCAGAPFERGPGVTLLPVDLAEPLGTRAVVDGADGTVLTPYR